MRKIIVAIFMIFLFASASYAGQSTEDLYRNSGTPLVCSSYNGAWAWPGSALTANTIKFYGSLANDNSNKIAFARWVVVWNPRIMSSTNQPTHIRLIIADDGPTNLMLLAQIMSPYGYAYNTPRVDAVNITRAYQNMVKWGWDKTVGHQTLGNGANGPLIYGSWIEIVWE